MAKKILLLILTVILSLGLFACAKETEQVEVTFVGLNDQTETKTVSLGDPVVFPQNPSEDGYEFVGWFLEEDEAKTEVIHGFKPANNITVYAHYRELDFYTVTFIDHNGEQFKKINVREDQRISFPTETPKVEDEKVFLNWYLDGTDTKVDAAYFESNPVTADITIRAKCTDKVKYILTLMIGDEVYKEYTVREDLEFTFDLSENTPVKENYRFEGWFDAQNTLYTGAKPTKNMTVYAHFSEIPLFVAYPAAAENTCNIIKLNEYYLDRVTALTIPETITINGVEHTVVGIAEKAFENASRLCEITIPSSVTSIAANAFSGCSALTSIRVDQDNTVYESNNSNAIVEKVSMTLLVACCKTTVYEGIKAIGKDAFLSCQKLTTLHIPASVSEIPAGFLAGCNMVEEITIDANNATYISVGNCLIRLSDTCLIQGCRKSALPEKFTVGEEEKTITSISPEAFAGCTTLTEINIPKSIQTIAANTFKGCTSLTKVTATNPTLSFEDNAFAECESIVDIAVAYELVEYFINLNKSILKNITITSGERIETKLFVECYALQTVKLPKSLTAIESAAFQNCKTLTTVWIEEGTALTKIGMNAFRGCSSLVAFAVEVADTEPSFLVPVTVQTIGEYAFSGCAIKTLAFEDGASIASIGYKAFADCAALSEISIPRNAKTVDYDAFFGCAALNKASLGAPIMRCLLVVSDSVKELYITSGDKLDYETVRALSALETLSLSKDIASIDARSLRACTKLVNIKVDAANTALKVENDYVLEIATGKLIFAAAKPEITLSENVKVIGAYAFVGTGIEKIVIPATVEKIESYAFSACRSLASLEILGKPVIEEFAFEGCDAITTVKAHEYAYAYLNKVTIESKEILPEANS